MGNIASVNVDGIGGRIGIGEHLEGFGHPKVAKLLMK